MEMTSTPTVPQRTEPLLFFIHIPKTAGTTLGGILVQHYGRDRVFACHPDRAIVGYTAEDFLSFPAEKRNNFQLVRGHFGYGLHEDYQEPYKYITILRDPVDRVISHYYYVLKRTDHYLHKKVTSENISLKDYVTSGLTGEMDNGQLRMLTGPTGYYARFGTCTPELLELAKEHLRNDFVVVGISERFDETLLVLKEILGVSTPFYLNLKVNNKRPKREKMTDDVIEAIRAHNPLDEEIYQYANALMDELIEKHIPFFRIKLSLFRLRLRIYGRLFQWSRALPKSLQEKLDRRFFKVL
jgi:hypothetical protein